METFIYITLGLIILWFVGGMITAALVGSKKNRSRAALAIFLGFSDDAKSMLLDIFKLHQMKKIDEVNSVVEKTTNTTSEITSMLSPENRLREFSSGKKFDRTTWVVYQKRFIEDGYSESSASLLAGVFFFELEDLLSEKK